MDCRIAAASAVVALVTLASLAAARLDSDAPGSVWFAPAPASKDLRRLFEAEESWSRTRERIDVFKFYQQHTLPGDPVVGPNTYRALSRAGAFRKVIQWGKRLALEVGAVKEFYCAAGDSGMREAIAATLGSIDAVQQAGGAVGYVAMDEPFLSGRSRVCGGPELDPTADRLAVYIRGVAQRRPEVRVGMIEAYPSFSVEQFAEMMQLTRERGVPLAFLHVDVDLAAIRPRRDNVRRDMARLSAICAAENVPFGVIVWGVNGDNAALYSADVMRLATEFGTGFAQWKRSPDHVIFQSWAASRKGRRAIPANLPEDDPHSFIGIMNRVLWIWGDVLVSQP